jgi:hypothetical protein
MRTERSRSRSKRREGSSLGNERNYVKHKNNAESLTKIFIKVRGFLCTRKASVAIVRF